jgi:hypothetical protein
LGEETSPFTGNGTTVFAIKSNTFIVKSNNSLELSAYQQENSNAS